MLPRVVLRGLMVSNNPATATERGRATGLLGQAAASQASAAGGAPAATTAALSYPTPANDVTAVRAAPERVPVAPAAPSPAGGMDSRPAALSA